MYRGLGATLAIVVLAVAPGDGLVASANSRQPRPERIAAHFAVLTLGCGGAYGVEFARKPGAAAYTISYHDAAFKNAPTGTFTEAQLAALDAGYVREGTLGAGQDFLPSTGGGSHIQDPASPPCPAPEPSDGGRFTGTPKVVVACRGGCMKVRISGRVLHRVCVGDPCQLDVVGVPNRAVAVSGVGGSQVTDTDANGNYEFVVRKGRQVVRVPAAAMSVKPTARTVVANSDTTGLNFDLCKVPQGYKGKMPGCGLVEIDGQTVDIRGAAYGSLGPQNRVAVFAPGDETTADTSGHFVLYVQPGTVTVTGQGYGPGIITGSSVVHATREMNHARITLPPGLFVSQATATEITLQLKGLPDPPLALEISVDLTSGAPGSSCRAKQTASVSHDVASRSATVVVMPDFPFTSWCSGTFAASLASGSEFLASTRFTIP